jgi:hypothetical protein
MLIVASSRDRLGALALARLGRLQATASVARQ